MAPASITSREGYDALNATEVKEALANGKLTPEQVGELENSREGGGRKTVLSLLDAGDGSTGTRDEIPRHGASGATPPSNSTTLDSNVSKPSTTAPGDGAADTTDPNERASSVTPNKAAAAAAGHETVNAVVPLKTNVAGRPTAEARFETYETTTPAGDKITIRRNINTGATERVA